MNFQLDDSYDFLFACNSKNIQIFANFKRAWFSKYDSGSVFSSVLKKNKGFRFCFHFLFKTVVFSFGFYHLMFNVQSKKLPNRRFRIRTATVVHGSHLLLCMTSEITQTTLSAECCNGPTNRQSAVSKISLKDAILTDIKSLKTV